MKYLILAIFSLFLQSSFAQDYFAGVTELELREEIFQKFKTSLATPITFPVCGFQSTKPMADAREALKASDAKITTFIAEAASMNELSSKIVQNKEELTALLRTFNSDLKELLRLVKEVDLSGTEPGPHVSSYCTTSELLFLVKNKSSLLGMVSVMASALQYQRYTDLTGAVANLQSALESFERKIQRAFRNDTHFISYLRAQRILEKSEFKKYKKHFRKLRRISNKQLREFSRNVRELSEDEREEFTQLLSSRRSAYKKLSRMHENRRRRLLNSLVVMSNITWGLPNTVVGGLVIAFGAVAAPFSPHLDMPRFEKSDSGKQIGVNVDNLFLFDSNVSLGLFQLKSNYEGVDEHEGGHAVQSAILGPLYLPVVIGDYLIEGSVADNFIEDHADEMSERLMQRITFEELTQEYY